MSSWADRESASDDSSTKGLAITFSTEGTIELYQTISETLSAGTYKLTAYVKSASSAKGFNGTSYSTDALAYAESETEVSSEWTEITHSFTIKSDMADYVVGVAITAESSAWVCLDDISLVCTEEGADGYTLEELKTLYDTAAALIEDKEEADFKEGYTALVSALSTAKTLIDADSEDSDAINTAYEALAAAKEALVAADVETTLYYYYEGDGELGLVSYNDSITSTADKASWYVWNSGDTYQVETVEGYAGWYSIPLTFAGDGGATGFELYAYESSGSNVATYSDWSNTDIFNTLETGGEDTYALKDGALYAGEMADAVRNQVTFYVYDDTGAPILAVKDQTLSKLSSTTETVV